MTLLEEAKELKIRGAHLMKDETLAEKIAEAKAEKPSIVETPKEEAVPEKSQKRIQEIQREADLLKRILGDHNQKYLAHISMYRDFIPKEYQDHKHLVDCYL